MKKYYQARTQTKKSGLLLVLPTIFNHFSPKLFLLLEKEEGELDHCPRKDERKCGYTRSYPKHKTSGLLFGKIISLPKYGDKCLCEILGHTRATQTCGGSTDLKVWQR